VNIQTAEAARIKHAATHLTDQPWGLRDFRIVDPDGSEFVDLQAATERGVIVTGTPAAVTPTPVSELAMAMVLGLAWRLLEADRFTREGRWRQNQSMAIITTGLEGKQIGIFGLGAIGMAVARRARSFGMRVSYHKRSRLDPEQERTLGVQWRSVDELFRESDFVVLSAPLTEETRGLVNAHRLSTMKPSSFLINVSRGAVVVEDDLVHALREGVIAGAGLDVHQHEPPAPNAGPHRDLCKIPNVLLTPHIGSATVKAISCHSSTLPATSVERNSITCSPGSLNTTGSV
jgi:glyoxylate reductase